MIEFKSVTVKNFLSFGGKEQTFNLGRNEVCLILGDNKDVGERGESRNGAGKTTIMNAVLFALYGKGIESIKTDEFINLTNGKGLSVELVFSIGETEYKITRTRKPNSLKFERDGESLTLDAMKNTDDLITKTIGYEYEVFVLLFFLSPTKKSFMAMGGAEQRTMIERLLDLDTLAKRADTLKSIASELNSDLKLSERDLENAKSLFDKEQSRYNRLLQQSEDFRLKIEQKLVSLNKELADIKSYDFDLIEKNIKDKESLEEKIERHKTEKSGLEQKQNQISQDIQRLKREIELYEANDEKRKNNASVVEAKIGDVLAAIDAVGNFDDLEKVLLDYENDQDLKEKLDALSSDKMNNERIKAETVRDITRLRDELDALKDGKCHACGQTHYDKDRVAELEELVKKKTKSVDTLDGAIENIDHETKIVESQLTNTTRQQFKEANESINKLDALLKDLDRLEGEKENNPYDHTYPTTKAVYGQNRKLLGGLVSESEGIVSEIDACEVKISSLNGELSEIPQTLTMDQVSQKKSRLSQIENEIKEVEQEENPYETEAKLVELPDVSEFEEAVKDIQNHVKHVKYLTKLLTDNKSFVRKNIVDLYIPYVNKKIVEYSQKLDLPHVAQINSDMSVEIEYMNKSVSYYNMSAGERLRLNIATTAAFKDLVSMLGRGSNLMLIDELFDGSLDTGGMFKAFRFMKGICPNILMISHRDELKGEVDTTILIEKENGFSTIKEI